MISETELQTRLARYVAREYPDVLFHSDFGSGVKLSKIQAVRQSRQNAGRRGWPDFQIMKFSENKLTSDGWNDHTKAHNIYFGLFLELKRDGEKLHPGNRAKKRFLSIDGKEYKTEHLREQADTLAKLRAEGYAATFAIGLKQAKELVDEYLGSPDEDFIEY